MWWEFVPFRSRLFSWWDTGCANTSRAPHQASHITWKSVPVLHWMVSITWHFLLPSLDRQGYSPKSCLIWLRSCWVNNRLTLMNFDELWTFFLSTGVHFGEVLSWGPKVNQEEALNSNRYPWKQVLVPQWKASENEFCPPSCFAVAELYNFPVTCFKFIRKYLKTQNIMTKSPFPMLRIAIKKSRGLEWRPVLLMTFSHQSAVYLKTKVNVTT